MLNIKNDEKGLNWSSDTQIGADPRGPPICVSRRLDQQKVQTGGRFVLKIKQKSKKCTCVLAFRRKQIRAMRLH